MQQPAITLTPSELSGFLLEIAICRPVYIWGAPGIGKSALVDAFGRELGMECVSLVGSNLAPEDLMGVPKIEDAVTRFFPPAMIARKNPYVLFLDELNACGHDIQKAFYSLIHDRRVGEYTLPEGSIVIGAGNRAQDSAIVRPLSSALINRMVHVHLVANTKDWINWAHQAELHPLVTGFIQEKPDYLWSQPPKHEEPFSSPRSWHMVSDGLKSLGVGVEGKTANPRFIEALVRGCLSPLHAGQFIVYSKRIDDKFKIHAIIKGDAKWPTAPEERDWLFYLAQSFRAHLIKELPQDTSRMDGESKKLSHKAKGLLSDLAAISLEMAQIVAAADEQGNGLPDWFMNEIVRDLPRIIQRK